MKDQLTPGGDGEMELSGASQASLQAQSFHLPSQPSQAPEPFLSSPAPHLEPSFKFTSME